MSRLDHHSGAEVFCYPHGDDETLGAQPGELHLGPENRDFVLTGVQVDKGLGGEAGSFACELRTRYPEELKRRLMDNDWVDIVLTEHAHRHHVLRGPIDDIRPARTIDGAGASREIFTLTGRDHTKPFEDTSVYFDRYSGENVLGGFALQAWAALAQSWERGIGGPRTVDGEELPGPVPPPSLSAELGVPRIVEMFLRGFMMRFAELGRSVGEMPPGMPGIIPTGFGLERRRYFNDNWRFITKDFTNRPERVAVTPWTNALDFESSKIWALAQQWSDPQFCELWCDLTYRGRPIEPGQEVDRDRTEMAVVLRDRPLPTAEPEGSSIQDSAWFQLPVLELAVGDVDDRQIVRGGIERRNAFIFQPPQNAVLEGQAPQLQSPLWDPDDIRRHGFRDLRTESPYMSLSEDSVLGMHVAQRRRLRDWHCLNPYLWSGSLQLTHGRPDAHVGIRVRDPDPQGGPATTYYLERVSHRWTGGDERTAAQTKTTLGVTRGWQGTDHEFISALMRRRARYVEQFTRSTG